MEHLLDILRDLEVLVIEETFWDKFGLVWRGYHKSSLFDLFFKKKTVQGKLKRFIHLFYLLNEKNEQYFIYTERELRVFRKQSLYFMR